MSIGGLAITPKRASEITTQMIDLRQRFGISKTSTEIEWKTAVNRRDDIYRAYVDLLFALIQNNQAHLHIRLTPMRNQRKTVEAVSKAFYQLMLHRAGRFYGKECRINFRPDDGCCSEYLPNMEDGLNSDIIEKFKTDAAPVVSIQQVSSKKEHLVQLLDVTLGAITSARNGYHKDGTLGDYKKRLAQYVLDKHSCTSEENHSLNQKKFNIWNVNPTTVRRGSGVLAG